MKNSDFVLAALAEIGAMRRLLIQALVLKLVEEPEPMQVLALLGKQLTNAVTTPPSDSGLDPAVSDLLAAMTDERMDSLVGDLRLALDGLTGEA